ncbi:hypothetical protein, partial [Lampropedia aestuarii]|uniref:hypothetical protein n=1 Tax=Lampropedia aestuarii TaxID=2562762 RepID=UPI0019805FAD
ALSAKGVPYVAYRDGAKGNKATVMRLAGTGTTWEPVGSTGFSAGTASFTSLAFGPDGMPYVAYQDSHNGYKATVMRPTADATTWEQVGQAGLSAGQATYISLALSTEGVPYVAYQ